MDPNQQPTSPPPASSVTPPPMPTQFPQQQPPQFSPQPPVPPQKSKKPLIFVGIGILVVLIILGVVLALLANKKPSSTSSTTTSSSSNSPTSSGGSNSEKTSTAKDASRQAIRYATLYTVDHNDAYPTQLSQLDAIEKSYPSYTLLSPTKITSAPSDPNTVNLYICKTDGMPDTLPRADYWDYTQGTLVQYTGYSDTDQHITSCSFLQ